MKTVLKTQLQGVIAFETEEAVKTLEPVGAATANWCYRVTTTKSKYFLKIYPSGSRTDREFEQAILIRLADSAPTVFFPVIHTGVFELDSMPAILFEHMEGREAQPSDMTLDAIDLIAGHQAIMHSVLADRDFGKKVRFGAFNLNFLDEFKLTQRDQLVSSVIAKLQQQSPHLQRGDLKRTVIHDDLSLSNLMVHADHRISFMDFDDAHNSFRISDIGTAIKETIIGPHGYNQQLIDRYLHEYDRSTSQGPLTPDEHASLKYMLLRRALFMFAYYSSKNEPLFKHMAKAEYASLETIANAIK